MKVGLVLEGGGMRGVYTSGVLDCMMDEQLQVGYIVGVSAGACNAVGYVSQQRGRSARINIEYAGDKRYVSLSNFIKTKSVFGMDFLFNEITNDLEPLDFDTMLASTCEFMVGVTDVETGEAVYYDKSCLNHDATVMRASSSIPIFSPIVTYKGRKYLDGGTSDPIPVRRALADGCDKVIVVLTRERGFERKPEQLKTIYSHVFKSYPHMIDLLNRRHEVYNASLAFVEELEKAGTAIVIAPDAPLGVGRFEKDKEKLKQVYQKGYDDTKARLDALRAIVSC